MGVLRRLDKAVAQTCAGINNQLQLFQGEIPTFPQWLKPNSFSKSFKTSGKLEQMLASALSAMLGKCAHTESTESTYRVV